jgi:hypothetical protein
MNVSEWKEQLLQEREQKDVFFKMHPQSPLPYNTRQKFNGLCYYLDLEEDWHQMHQGVLDSRF